MCDPAEKKEHMSVSASYGGVAEIDPKLGSVYHLLDNNEINETREHIDFYVKPFRKKTTDA